MHDANSQVNNIEQVNEKKHEKPMEDNFAELRMARPEPNSQSAGSDTSKADKYIPTIELTGASGTNAQTDLRGKEERMKERFAKPDNAAGPINATERTMQAVGKPDSLPGPIAATERVMQALLSSNQDASIANRSKELPFDEKLQIQLESSAKAIKSELKQLGLSEQFNKISGNKDGRFSEAQLAFLKDNSKTAFNEATSYNAALQALRRELKAQPATELSKKIRKP